MKFGFSQRTGWPLEESRWAKSASAARARGAVDLTESNPSRCAFRFFSPAILLPFSGPSNLDYRPDPFGLPAARQAVTRYYAEKNADISPNHIVLTAGTSEAYSYLFKLLADPGQTVLVPAPGYPLLGHLADLSDMRLSQYPLAYGEKTGWTIDRAAFLERLTPGVRVVVVVHPNNPTGHRTGDADRAWLEGLAAERGFALIADEVFLDFSFDPVARPATFAAGRSALTFTLSGISKILGLPQMKLSWIAVSGPEAAAKEALSRLAVMADAYLTVSGPPQRALAEWLSRKDEALAEIGGRVRENRAVLESALAGKKARLLRADGGWYGVLRFEDGRSDEDVSLALADRGVLVQPGYLFDLPEHHLVASLLPEPEAFRDGTRRLADFLV